MIALLLTLLLAQPTPRHAAVVRAFYRLTGYPHGRPGYVVDHKIPLCLGGADAVSNLMWQTLAESRRKDADERRLCAALRRFEQKWIPRTP